MWAMAVMASGKRGVITQSKGKGRLKVTERCHRSGCNEMMDKANTITLALTVSNVFGTIGLPASSFMAAMFAAQRMAATLMKTELFAMCRPTQILCVRSIKGESTETLGLYIPRSEALRQNVSEPGELSKKTLSDDLQRLRVLWVKFDGQVMLIIPGIMKRSPSESGTQLSQ